MVGIIYANTDGYFGASELDRFPHLKVISAYGVGTDHLDVKLLTQRGVVVSNTPDAVTDGTAEMALLLLLATVRELVRYDRFTRQEGFPPYRADAALSGEVTGKTVGILGYGRVGKRIAELLAPLRVRVLYHQRKGPDSQSPTSWKPLHALARESDILVVATPLTPSTRHLVNGPLLDEMPRGSYVINIARGPVVDEQALVERLHSGAIRGAGLDVFENEPAIHPDLLVMDQVVLSPHRGTSTNESRSRMTSDAVGNLVHALNGSPINVVAP